MIEKTSGVFSVQPLPRLALFGVLKLSKKYDELWSRTKNGSGRETTPGAAELTTVTVLTAEEAKSSPGSAISSIWSETKVVGRGAPFQ